jgi:hypothetical protein
MKHIENNKLIAEFMGAFVEELYNGKYRSSYLRANGETSCHTEISNKAIAERIAFCGNWHCSWDWLIPVVEKIEEINDPHHGYFGVYINSNGCIIQGTNLWKSLQAGYEGEPVYMINCIYPTKLEAVYNAVIGFIKWYNNEKNTIS